MASQNCSNRFQSGSCRIRNVGRGSPSWTLGHRPLRGGSNAHDTHGHHARGGIPSRGGHCVVGIFSTNAGRCDGATARRGSRAQYDVTSAGEYTPSHLTTIVGSRQYCDFADLGRIHKLRSPCGGQSSRSFSAHIHAVSKSSSGSPWSKNPPIQRPSSWSGERACRSKIRVDRREGASSGSSRLHGRRRRRRHSDRICSSARARASSASWRVRIAREPRVSSRDFTNAADLRTKPCPSSGRPRRNHRDMKRKALSRGSQRSR
jgi:hypothetical protein